MFYIIASFVIGTCNKNACRFHPLPWFSCWLVLVYITDKINCAIYLEKSQLRATTLITFIMIKFKKMNKYKTTMTKLLTIILNKLAVKYSKKIWF